MLWRTTCNTECVCSLKLPLQEPSGAALFFVQHPSWDGCHELRADPGRRPGSHDLLWTKRWVCPANVITQRKLWASVLTYQHLLLFFPQISSCCAAAESAEFMKMQAPHKPGSLSTAVRSHVRCQQGPQWKGANFTQALLFSQKLQTEEPNLSSWENVLVSHLFLSPFQIKFSCSYPGALNVAAIRRASCSISLPAFHCMRFCLQLRRRSDSDASQTVTRPRRE